jgi:hypothetical protein
MSPEGGANGGHIEPQRHGSGPRDDEGNKEAGPLRPRHAQRDDDGDRSGSNRNRGRIGLRQRGAQRRDLRDEVAGKRHAEAQQVLDLGYEDRDGDTGREAGDHRVGNVLDEGAEPQCPHDDEDRTGDERGKQQAIVAVALDSGKYDHDERRRRPADLEAAAAKRRDEESRDDRGDQPVRRRRTGRNADRHGKGQGDDRNRQARDNVAAKVGQGIALAEGTDQLRRQEVGRSDGARSLCGAGHRVLQSADGEP